MTYDSLLLNCGGGIISDHDKSAQYTGSAALCIGVGGTGIAALSDLKGKIYQQLQPDNPGESIPRYEAIQLLGIDSDETDYKKYRGNCQLSDDEFVSIKKDNLTNILSSSNAKALIKKDPKLNWMEIDRITKMLSPQGAGGIRQMGRYMLMERVSAVTGKIQDKAKRALTKRNSKDLDIYIFAGISGGTGSGCFLDVSYLTRQVVKNNGWSAQIMGYFFLPDVVTSKDEVSKNPGIVAYNNSNGYAAMKELDYLMDLPCANDWFEQSYGAGYHIKTQEPPVDMCHLISAQQADGKQVLNGFGYGINVASDYAISYMAEVDTNGNANDESGLTMRGHLANVAKGVQGLARRHGANLSYHILGASNAEIPMNQINTYLSIGFFKKFRECAYRPKTAVTDDIVQDFMEKNRFTVADVYNDLVNGSEGLNLIDIDRKVLASEPCCERKTLPKTWATGFNSWLSECRGTRSRNASSLTKTLNGYDYSKANDQSLIGRLFRKLYDLSTNPEYGPYYAAALLDNGGQDLYAALTGQITTALEKANDQYIQLDNLYQWKMDCNQTLIDKKGNKKAYANFKAAVEDLGITVNTYDECNETAEVFRNFREQAKALYDQYFRPLCAMLDNLRDTFYANEVYLKTPEAKQANAYTWQIFSLDDVKSRLDKSVEDLNETVLVNRFLGHLLEKSEYWLSGKHDQIALVVKEYMLRLFEKETSRSLEDYLYKLYDIPEGKVAELSTKIREKILNKVDADAVPMFWCDHTYNINSSNVTFPSNRLSVPSASSAVCSAAEDFKGNNGIGYTLRKTGINDRIFALRFLSGVPLFAYHGITLLKADYDKAAASANGAGSHLYADTGRGKDNSGFKDWRRFLPTPMPYSRNPELVTEGDNLVKLYKEGIERGVIGKMPTRQELEEQAQEQEFGKHTEEYAIFETPALTLKDYTLDDFMDHGEFSKHVYDTTLAELEKTYSELHRYGVNLKCTAVNLKNDADPDITEPEEVRMDYFIHYPLLQKVVRNEIRKDKELKAVIDHVKEIRSDYDAYMQDLDIFSRLLFYRIIRCTNDMGDLDYETIHFASCDYNDIHGDEHVFSLCDKNMPYAQFPLYQAFRSYRTLGTIGDENTENLDLDRFDKNDLRRLRKQLDEAQAAYHNQKRKADDYVVPAIIDQTWSSEALKELRNETLRSESEAVRNTIYRFYNELRRIVVEVKKKSTAWPKNRKLDELNHMLRNPGAAEEQAQAQVQSQVQPQAPITFAWVYGNGKTLELHPAMSLNMVFDREANTWVQLTTQMMIARNNQWVPVQLDAAGNVIL